MNELEERIRTDWHVSEKTERSPVRITLEYQARNGQRRPVDDHLQSLARWLQLKLGQTNIAELDDRYELFPMDTRFVQGIRPSRNGNGG